MTMTIITVVIVVCTQ